jgi:hyaluronate lyase
MYFIANKTGKIVTLSWFVILFTLNTAAAKADSFDSLRHKWADFLVGNTTNEVDPDIKFSLTMQDAEASRFSELLAKGMAAGQSPWKDLTYTYSKDITTGYRRLMVMALAYQSNRGKLFHNAQLKQNILAGLNWLYEHQYNERMPLPIPAEGSDIHNWWDYKIGIPLLLNDIVVLLYDELPADQRSVFMQAIDHFTPNWVDRYTRKPAVVQYTAANRIWICRVIGVRALILKDDQRFKMASDSLVPVFEYASSGDGFYKDGSFIQHVKHPYTGGYGVSLLNSLAEEIYLFAGTPAAVKSNGIAQVYNWIYNSFAPIIFKGNLMSMVEGREISRPDAQGDRKGELVVQAIALLAKAAPPADKAKLVGLVKYWFNNRTQRTDFYSHMAGNYISVVKQVQFSKDAADLPPAYIYRQFSHMDRAVQQTPEYGFGISMFSSRIFNYETRTDYENKKAWHTGDGMTYLYNADTEQYNDDFWATVNYNHLPGTTVQEGSHISGFKNSSKSWVGGAALLNRYGISGMDMATPGQTLSAKKSWFMLDGEIIALGAAINSHDSAVVNTYIEQRRLKPDDSNTFTVNGQTADPKTAVFMNAHWAHLSGNVPGADIGYYFPGAMTLQAARQAQSGSWHDVNVNYNSKVFTQNYLTLWQDQTSSTATYAYVLLPGFSKEAVAAYAAKPDVHILSNTDKVQAVYSQSRQLTAANFWQPTTAEAGDVACSGQASVLVMRQAGSVHIAFSDPTMRGGDITITLKGSAIGISSADPEIKVVSLQPVIKLRFNGKRLDGRTAEIALLTSK